MSTTAFLLLCFVVGVMVGMEPSFSTAWLGFLAIVALSSLYWLTGAFDDFRAFVRRSVESIKDDVERAR